MHLEVTEAMRLPLEDGEKSPTYANLKMLGFCSPAGNLFSYKIISLIDSDEVV